MSEQHTATQRHRLDKWLWCTRFFKTRGAAVQAISGGKIHLNGERVKASHPVRPGDQLSISMPGIVAQFTVVGLPARRGTASDAHSQYVESPDSVAHRARLREQLRLAAVSRPQSDGRPDKRERRVLLKLQRRQT